jgi:seryl-tRNA synthetase
MLDIKFIRANREKVEQALKNRRSDLDITPLFEIDQRRRELLREIEELRNRRNTVSAGIGQMKKNREDASEYIAEMKKVGARIKEIDRELSGIEEQFREFLLSIPNIPHESVPVGKSEEENVEVKRLGKIQEMTFEPLPHWDVGENLGILDFKRAAKITGARFCVYNLTMTGIHSLKFFNIAVGFDIGAIDTGTENIPHIGVKNPVGKRDHSG